MARINEVLAKLTFEKGKGKAAPVARKLGILPQTFGNYLKDRPIPTDLIAKWQEVYGEDLLALSKTKKETNVSRETKESFRDEIFEGDYIGMHNRVWTQHELTMATQRELLKELVKKLTNSGGDQ